jgi:hypothetical protein
MSKVSKRRPIVMPTLAEDRAITTAARSDPDAQPLTPTQLKAMVRDTDTGTHYAALLRLLDSHDD